MEEQEIKNFLRGEGVELTEVAVPTIDVSERVLADIADDIESEGPKHLLSHIGTLSNTFKTENEFSCSPDVLCEGVKVIYTTLIRVYNGLNNLKGDAPTLANIDRQTKAQYRQYMAVLFFLIYKSFVEIERAMASEASNLSIMAQQHFGGGRGRGRKRAQVEEADDSKYQFWLLNRPRIVSEVLKLMTSPFDEIWHVNSDNEYNFMRCVTLAFCTTIKNKSKKLRHSDPESEEIFDILGILAAKHQEEKGILTRLIPLLKGSEETASIIADGIARMINKVSPDRAQSMVLRTLTEAWDTYSSRLEKDPNAEKGFHAFLTQLSIQQPKGFLHSLAVLVQFLEADSVQVRNAVVIAGLELMKYTWMEMKEEEEGLENDEERDERPNIKNWLEMRRKVLDEILLLHTQDQAAVVRTKSIQMLTQLVQSRNVYPAETMKIMTFVRKRLLDKNNLPRKAAAQLVIDIVKAHPHVVRPREEYNRKRKEHLNKIVQQILQDHHDQQAKGIYFVIKEFHHHTKMEGFYISKEKKDALVDPATAMKLLEEDLKEKRYWEACETMFICVKRWAVQWEQILVTLQKEEGDPEEEIYLQFFKSIHADLFPEKMEDLELEEINYIAPQKIIECRAFLKYVQCNLLMKDELEKCQPSLRKLLELGTTIDKKEAVLFFAAICEAGYQPPRPVTISIINALAQLTDDELKDFVDPFKFIFIGPDNFGPHRVVKKLLELMDQLSENLAESLSSIIGQLYLTGSLNAESIKILWDAFSLSTGDWNPKASSSAVFLLGVIGQLERKIITTNLSQLIDIGLGPRGLEDYELAKVTLQTILQGCRSDKEDDDTDIGKSKKGAASAVKKGSGDKILFPPNHDLFVKIIDLMEYGLKSEGKDKIDIMYPSVVELSTQIIYRMCTEPSEIIKRFLPNVHGLVFGEGTIENPGAPAFSNTERSLFRYMCFGKALLGAHITYYEQIVAKEIKERKALKEKIEKKNKTKNRQRGNRMSSANITNNSVMNQTNQDAAQAEMDLVMGHIGFDAEQDQIKSYVGKLLDTGFFRQFRMHVLYLCNEKHYSVIKSVNLKVALVQALAKVMLVCENSVTASLSDLSRLWKSDQPFAVRLEILRASIRLTVKFPNPMEKMNDVLATGLLSADSNVRKACMDYIGYLALSDLLKVREQLPDTAACLCDESFELREMAKDFINQISEKDSNVLQNCIPEVISRLSTREDISQEGFQRILKVLLTKIKKEKQLGGVVERIVARFKTPASVRTCQDTIYALNQIQQNDKTLKIMKDNINIYADKLGDPIVWESFMELLSTFRKMNKTELKQKIDDWEKELHDHHDKCVALDAADQAAKRKNQKVAVVNQAESSDEGEDENEQTDGEAAEAHGDDDNEGGQEGTAEETEGGQANESEANIADESEANIADESEANIADESVAGSSHEDGEEVSVVASSGDEDEMDEDEEE